MLNTPASQNDFSKATVSMNSLLQAQDLVDSILASLPDSVLEKADLLSKRNENRAFFTNSILPGWQKIKDYFSGEATTRDLTLSGEFDSTVTSYISTDGLG